VAIHEPPPTPTEHRHHASPSSARDSLESPREPGQATDNARREPDELAKQNQPSGQTTRDVQEQMGKCDEPGNEWQTTTDGPDRQDFHE
jgi:hypothetical protein